MWPAKVVARRGLATLKLTYFNLAGRAELTRLALYIGDIYFEDDRISMQRLKNLKQSLPYGQLPVLMVDDLVMAQSHPIAKYAGTLAGLYPHNEPLDAFKRAVRAKELVDVKLPTMFQLLERRLVATSTGNPYLLDSLSLADLEIYLTVHMLKTGLLHDVHTHAVSDAYPHVMSIYDAIKQHPKVVEWNHRKN
ncbi:hypothetical protein DYB26_007815 [Aphanomyces astaci]|uniref:GST N-terminal domain-containing protein n=1 Tax=Aphanomyces astaci TaxID=112090 RepID=A0A397BF54_APHAT|nr:hypothetical protein DYB36_010480 [Aphanomyces astaci]RHY56093.1 hypothetical protein DYB34_011351 [Aphanomyces astaci]RHY82159.1 hypothetical protein DYB26_007815 [Aphanomyces astaci]RHZ07346.1 hypothetical protein DYB31_008854 [Aphanomyces astaci]